MLYSMKVLCIVTREENLLKVILPVFLTVHEVFRDVSNLLDCGHYLIPLERPGSLGQVF